MYHFYHVVTEYLSDNLTHNNTNSLKINRLQTAIIFYNTFGFMLLTSFFNRIRIVSILSFETIFFVILRSLTCLSISTFSNESKVIIYTMSDFVSFCDISTLFSPGLSSLIGVLHIKEISPFITWYTISTPVMIENPSQRPNKPPILAI